MSYKESLLFENINFTRESLVETYEGCQFLNCNFSSVDLSKILFLNCNFTECDFSLATLSGTGFQEVSFGRCKLIGLHFDQANQFALSFKFSNCLLNYSSFAKMKLKNIAFKDCQMQEVFFSETDLSKAIFDKVDLTDAVFEYTNLAYADFSTAENYTINPEINKLKKTKFSELGLRGLLRKYDIVIE